MKNFTKLSKKALSLIVALVMIFSVCSVSFGAFAEAADYIVEYNNPAIPMYAQTTVDLSAVSVYLTDDYLADGSDINWSTEDDSIELDNSAKTLTIYAEGVYELYATYNGITKTVVAIVLPEDATGDENGIYEATLFEYDFTTGTWEDFKKDWSLQRKLSNVASFSAPAAPQISTKTYSTSGFVPFVASYNDETGTKVNNYVYFNKGTRNIGYMYLKQGNAVENFSDYNVYATGYLGQTAYSGETSTSGSGTSRAGILGRVVLNKDGVLDYKSDYQAALTSIVNYGDYKVDSAYAHLNAYFTSDACMLWDYDGTKDTTYDYFGTNVTGIAVGNLYTVYARYDGNEITTGLTKGEYETATAFAERTINSECTEKESETSTTYKAGDVGLCVEQPGTVGFMYNGAETQLQKFRVTHNIDLNNMPVVITTEPVTYFTVDGELPYFVMYENTTVDLSKFIVTIDGTGYVGNQLEWSTTDTGIVLDSENLLLTSGAYGNYTLTATKDGVSADVYLYVIKEGDTEVNIIDYDFTTGSWEDWSKDWGIQSAKNGSGTVTWNDPVTSLTQSTYDYSTNNIKGIVPFVTAYKNDAGTTVKTNLQGQYVVGFMYSKNPLIAKMSDYTITAKAYLYDRGYSNSTSSSRSGENGWAGLVGRIGLVDGVVTTASTYEAYPISWYRSSVNDFPATIAAAKEAGLSAFDGTTSAVTLKGYPVRVLTSGLYKIANAQQYYAPDSVGNDIDDTNIQKQYITYQTVFSGNNATVGFGLEDSVATDTTTIANTSYRLSSSGTTIYQNGSGLNNQNTGTVGFCYFGVEDAIQNFKATVALDTARIPETVVIPEPEYTEVAADAELRMSPDVKTDLSMVRVTFSDGTQAVGAAVQWSCSDSNITIENNVLSAAAEGGYALTATSGDNSRTVNLYVVDGDATDITLADFDFTDADTKANWNQYFGLNFSTSGKSKLAVSDTLPTTSYSAKGIVPFTYNINGTKYGSQGNTDNGLYGVFYLKDDFVASLSDYTVNAKFAMFGSDKKAPYNNGGSASHMSGFGLASRIVVGEDGVVDDLFKMNVWGDWAGSTLVGYLNSTKLATNWTYTNWSAFTSMQAVCNDTSVSVTLAGSETVELTDSTYSAGTAGMFYKGVDFDLRSFTVTHSLANSEFAPVAVIEEEPTPTVMDGINIGVNEVINLGQVTAVFKGANVLGSEIEWSADDNNAYELNGTKLYTFGEADFALNATYGGITKTINVSIKKEYNNTNENAVNMLSSFDGGSLALSKYGYGKYIITVNANDGYILKAGSLKVNVGGQTIGVTARANAAGTVFGFNADSIDGAVVSAEFVENDIADIAMLGGTIRLETADKTSGIRFGGRVNNIKSAKMTETIVVDGKTYKTLGIGSLFIPSALIKDGGLTVDTENVKNKVISSLIDSTENYADVAVTLTGIPEGKSRDLMISARTYVMYEDENGDTQYYYSDIVERSYNEVYNIVYPTVEHAGAISDIVSVESADLSGLNKEFAFKLSVVGRYTVEYVLERADGTQISSGVISSLDAFKPYSKIVALGDTIGKYKLNVTVKDADLTGRESKTDLTGAYTITVYDEDILISDTQRYLNQQSCEYGNTKGEGTTYLKFTLMSDQHYAWSSYGDGNNSYMNQRKNFAESLNKTDTEFVFMPGDNVDWALAYRSNIQTNQNLYVLQEALAPLTDKDVYAIFGNHDTDTHDFANRVVINAGNVTILGYSSTYQALAAGSGEVRSTTVVSNSTINWLKEQCEAALERNPDTHLVFINHYAVQNNTAKFIWPMLYDGDADLAAQKKLTLNRNKLLDVIAQYGVELYINGHEHNNSMNFEEITYENGLGTGCINYNCGNNPTDCIIEEYIDENGDSKLRVTMDQYAYGSFTSVVDDMSSAVSKTVSFDLIDNGLTAEETIAAADEYYTADAALRAEYSGKYNDLYSYSFEFAGTEIVDGVKCYKFNVSRLLYYVSDSTTVYDESVTDKTGILREALETVYISGDGIIIK